MDHSVFTYKPGIDNFTWSWNILTLCSDILQHYSFRVRASFISFSCIAGCISVVCLTTDLLLSLNTWLILPFESILLGWRTCGIRSRCLAFTMSESEMLSHGVSPPFLLALPTACTMKRETCSGSELQKRGGHRTLTRREKPSQQMCHSLENLIRYR